MKTSLLLAGAVSSAMAFVALPASAQTAPPVIAPTTSSAHSTPPPTGGVKASGSGSTATRPSAATASTVTGRSSTASVESAPTLGEPNVRRTVIEDRGARIDELKVRGQTRRITVTPKQGVKLPYEVLPDDGTGMGDSAAAQTPHGNEGRRVWNVLSF